MIPQKTIISEQHEKQIPNSNILEDGADIQDIQKYLHRPKRVPVVIITVVIMLYLIFLQPIIAMFFFPPIVHSGTYLYNTNLYRLFDQSHILELGISSLPNFQEAEVTHFSYQDQLLCDSVYYGKSPDLFIIELNFNEHYEEAKQYVVQNSDENLVADQGELFLLQCAIPEENATFCVTFLEQSKICRCILITERDYSGLLPSVPSALHMGFGVIWDRDALPR